MTDQSIVVRKRRFFGRNTIIVFVLATIVLLIGTVVQMRMTWSREQMRNVSDDASDAIASVRGFAGEVFPFARMFQEFSDLIHSSF